MHRFCVLSPSSKVNHICSENLCNASATAKSHLLSLKNGLVDNLLFVFHSHVLSVLRSLSFLLFFGGRSQCVLNLEAS